MSSLRSVPSIFTELAVLDSTNAQAVVTFVETAYQAIKAQGYQEGSGDRQLLRTMLDNEPQPLSRQIAQRLHQTLTQYEKIMVEETDPHVDARVFLLSTYATLAESTLDMIEDQKNRQDNLLQLLNLSKKFSLSDFKPLQWFADYLAEFITEIHLDQDLTLSRQLTLLKKMVVELTLLHKLINQILKIESIYQPEKTRGVRLQHPVFVELQGMVLDCATEALQLARPTRKETNASPTPVTDALKINDASPVRWFYQLWIQLLAGAEKFKTASKTHHFHAPKLTLLLRKHILADVDFKAHAAYCTKQLTQVTKEELLTKNNISIRKE